MLPALHLGRDAALAAALVLDVLARSGRSLAETVAASPRYVIVKVKVPRRGGLEDLYTKLEAGMTNASADRQDGLRLAWPGRWLHVRPSGTEPVVRLIAEAPTADGANDLVNRVRALL
jgi:phosphomannomutase